MIRSSDQFQIKDCKIFRFNGEPKFLFVASKRNMNLKKPIHFNEMLNIARMLSKPFPHVRVDLYDEEGKAFFGELTFYHFGGFTKFEPDECDYKLREYFVIREDSNNV